MKTGMIGVYLYIDDEPILFSVCTDMKYVNKAIELIKEAGWDEEDIEVVNVLLNHIVIDNEEIDLTV